MLEGFDGGYNGGWGGGKGMREVRRMGGRGLLEFVEMAMLQFFGKYILMYFRQNNINYKCNLYSRLQHQLSRFRIFRHIRSQTYG